MCPVPRAGCAGKRQVPGAACGVLFAVGAEFFVPRARCGPMTALALQKDVARDVPSRHGM